MSEITCELTFEGDSVQQQAICDEKMYNYPAYITSDGYDYVYEYALLDEENNRIIYVLLSYPEYLRLSEYRDYLKKDSKDYRLDNDKVLEYFSIYAYRFPGEDIWLEYGD